MCISDSLRTLDNLEADDPEILGSSLAPVYPSFFESLLQGWGQKFGLNLDAVEFSVQRSTGVAQPVWDQIIQPPLDGVIHFETTVRAGGL